MNYRIAILCSSVISASTLYSETDAAQRVAAPRVADTHKHLTPVTKTLKLNDDELATLRDQVTQQTIQIKGILDTLCDSVHSSTLPTKETICRELTLLCQFVQNMVEQLPVMSYKNLRNLIKINNQLLGQLKEQLSSGDLCGLCDLDASLFTTLEHPTRDVISPEEVVADVNQINQDINAVAAEVSYIQGQINTVWNLVTSISLAPYAQTAAATSSTIWDFINTNKGYAAGAALLAGTAYLFRDLSAEELIEGIVKRIPVYSLVALYVLRQKKDKDTIALANNWFGENSYGANTMITLKKWVGSPKEKKPAVHIIARSDMSFEEQQRWADDNNCTVLKIQKARDCDFLKNFVEFEDGLFKLPLAVLFSCQAKEDLQLISNRMGSLAKYIVTCLLSKK